MEGISPDILEKQLSKFEGEVASTIKKAEQDLNMNKEFYEVVLNLIALLAVRNPQMRQQWTDSETRSAEMIMAMTLATREQWESTIASMERDGVKIDDNVSYEGMKEFFESDKFEITVPTERHIELEFHGVNAILSHLFQRKWSLVVASDKTGPFITCDRPVALAWKHPDQIHPFYRASSGFGMKDTQVVFSLSRKLALIGDFEGEHQIINGTKKFVSAINSRVLSFALTQVYSPKLMFYYMDQNGALKDGRALLEQK